MNRSLGNALIVSALFIAGCSSDVETAFSGGFEGECPAISRDGRYLAFQRVEGVNVHLGVMDLATGSIDWAVRGATTATKNENAFHPAWGPGNALVYSYANITNTAYRRFSAKRQGDGYSLRVRQGGVTRDIIGDFARNFNPSFSPDGGCVYFCRQNDGFTGLARIDLRGGKPDEFLALPARDTGLGQPVVSPDGKALAYAELADSNWTLKVAALPGLDERSSVIPGAHTAYAPNWTPDGRHLVYTGFAPGDPCWGVYIVNVRDRSFRRLADGTDPCVTPDGKFVYYSRTGRIYRRALSADDFPVAAVPPPDPRSEPMRKIATFKDVAQNREVKTVKFDTTGLPSFASWYMRISFDWDGSSNNCFLLSGSVTGAGNAYFFVIGGAVSFHAMGGPTRFVATDGRPLAAGTHRACLVHGSDGVFYGRIDGGPWVARSGTFETGPLKGVAELTTFPNGVRKQAEVRDFEFGVGWPEK